MTFTDETLSAYVDGELDAATRAALEGAMATDPQLAQRLARQCSRSRSRSGCSRVRAARRRQGGPAM